MLTILFVHLYNECAGMLNRCIVTKQMKKSGIYQLYIQYNLTEIYSSRLARFQMKCPVVVSFVSPIFTEALPGGS